MMTTRCNFLKLMGIVAIALVTPSFVGSAEVKNKPNIIFILADDMGIGDASCYNPESKIITPNIDRLAKEGMMFTDAHAPGSICVPSRYGLLTGRYPFRKWSEKYERKIKRGDIDWIHFGLPNLRDEVGETTTASLLKKNNYRTACFGKWHLGIARSPDKDGKLSHSPIIYGFDYYFGIDAPAQPPYAFIENDRFVQDPTKLIPEQFKGPADDSNYETQGAYWFAGRASPDWDFTECLPTINKKAVEYIEKQKDSKDPFFMYVAYPSPHVPWMPIDKFKGKSGAGKYGDYMLTVDACVGDLLKALDKNKLSANTLVFYSSDNGPVSYVCSEKFFTLYQHNASQYNSSGILKGSKGSLDEGGHRMPFIARWPGKIKAGSTCDQLIGFTDMMATFAAIVGDKLPEDAGEDSFNFLPFMLSEEFTGTVRKDMVHSHCGCYNLAFRQRDWKLILPYWVYIIKDRTITPAHLVDTSGKHGLDAVELYNLKDDPSEKKNLADEMPEKAQAMFEALKANIEKGGSRPGYKEK